MAGRNLEREADPVGSSRGYAARPGPDSRIAVLLLPTIFGIDCFARAMADSLCASGIAALVWNPYPGATAPSTVPEALLRATALRDDVCIDQMSDCVSHLLARPGVEAVATAGFCLGGRFSLLLCARDHRLGACLAYYPSIRVPRLPHQDRDAVACASDIACPVQLVYPGRDEVIEHETFLRLQAALQGRRAPTVVHVYPEASHSFMAGSAHSVEADATAARLSWPQSIAFLTACLSNTSRCGG